MTTQKEVIDFVKEHPGCTSKEIEKFVGGNPRVIIRQLLKYHDSGLDRKKRFVTKGTYMYYFS